LGILLSGHATTNARIIAVRLFLSAPFTQYVTTSDSSELESFRVKWSGLIHALEGSGHEVLSAHRRESWGTRLDPPAVALAADLEGLRACDLVIAYSGDPPSPGVQLELGYAVAIERPILVFTERGHQEPYLLRGLPAVSEAEVIDIDAVSEIETILAKKGLIGPLD
jgi:nucleoside 2-deoxyribosyltransferase